MVPKPRTRTPPPDKRRIAAFEGFIRAQRALVERLDADLRAEHDLSLGDYEILLRLARAGDNRLKMVEVARSMVLTPSGVTRATDRLEAEGLVRRDACPTDRRSWFLALTPEGRARLRRAAPTHLRGIQEHFGQHLTDAEADALARGLGKVADSMEG